MGVSYSSIRMTALMPGIELPALPDFLIFKIHRGILCRAFKEDSKHIHIQRFAESAWPCKQGYLGSLIQKILDEHGLIHVIIIGAGIAKIRNPDRI
jgi:hypothetical protein